MAGALGMLLGAGLQYASGYANEKLQQKQQQETAAHSAMQDALANTPGFAETPEGQKALKNMVGPEYAPIVASALKFKHQMMQKAQQEYEGAMGGGGGSAAPSASTQMVGAAGGGGRFSQPQQIVRQAPNQMPPMSVTGPNSPPEPTSVGTAPQPTNGSAMPNDPATLRDWADRGERFLGSPEAANSGFSKEQLDVMKNHVTELRNQAKEIETQTQHQQFHEDTEADRAQTRQMQLQNHQDMLGLHQQALAAQEQQRQFMQQMATAKSDEDRNVHFQNASKNLATQTANIAKMLTSSTPSDPATIKSLLDQRNAQARELKAQADKNKIDYDPDQFKPLTTRSAPGWLKTYSQGIIGGDKTTIETDDSAGAAKGTGSAPTTSKSGKPMAMGPDGKMHYVE